MAIDITHFRDKRVCDYLYYYATETPNKEAICNSEISYTYADLKRQVESCAKALLAYGIKKGDRVATLSPPHPDYFIIFLATTTIGGIWIGLNSRYTRDELEHVISDSEPSIIFARTRIGNRHYEQDLSYFEDKIESIKRIIVLDEDSPLPGNAFAYQDFLNHGSDISDEILSDTQNNVVSDDAALIVYTSGTTGKPKGAVLHHYGAIRHSHIQSSLRSDGEVRQLNPYPINHIAGVIAGSIYCLVFGGMNFFLEKFDPEIVLKNIEQQGITTWGGVPIMLQNVLNHPDFPNTDLSSIQEVSYSGGTVSKSLLERITKEVCPAISTMYAMTEAAGVATAIPCTDDVDLLAESVGRPVADCEFRLVDESGKDVEQGERGEILIRGPFIMKGYWRSPEATKEAIDEDGWLHTKDVALEREDGNMVLVGRLSDMYKSGGYNIYPREIEQVLESHSSISLACVLGVPDSVYQEVGYAFVTLTPGQSADEQSLLQHCRNRLANYKVPKYLVIEKSLPLLPNNKPDKRKLKETACDAVRLTAEQLVISNSN